MGAFISTELEAHSVIEAMLEDSGFALDMWETIAEYLDRGALKDDAADIVAGMDKEVRLFVLTQFEDLVSALKFRSE